MEVLIHPSVDRDVSHLSHHITHSTLESLLTWIESDSSANLLDMVQQDEFTTDILVGYDGLVLAYDST